MFLSDPNGYLYARTWPEPVDNPPWTNDGSVSCQSTQDDLTLELGDANSSFSYRIDPTTMPPSVRGLTLVMCEECSYMWGHQGMNIGGISALFNHILIDYSAGKVGFKPKSA